MSIAIVGGGIGGLIAAFTVKQYRPESEVLVIEASSQLGGLLGLSASTNDIQFDVGTHIPAETQIVELDQFLFGELNPKCWNFIPRIRGGNYFNSSLNESHHNICSVEYMDELRDGEALGDVENITTNYRFRFGNRLTDEIFLPSINKFLSTDPNNLEPEVQKYFALDRLSAHSGRHRYQKANDPLYQTKIDMRGKKIPTAFYPNNGRGVSYWISSLTKKLTEMGVKFKKGTKIEAVQEKYGKIRKLIFANSNFFDCEHVVWTAPLETLSILSSSKNFLELTARYSRSPIKLFHYLLDRPYLTKCHYVNCFDMNFSPYRITFYENFAGTNQAQNGYRCTVEVVGEHAKSSAIGLSAILSQIKAMGLIHKDTRVIYSYDSGTLNGFPLPALGSKTFAKAITQELLATFSNLTLTGSSELGVFFSNEVMIKTYSHLKEVLSQGSRMYDPTQ